MEERDAPLYLASHRLRGEGDHEVVEGGLRRRPVPDRRALNERTASSEKRHYEPIDTAAPFRLAPLATHPLNGGGQVKWRRGSPFKNGARRAPPPPSEPSRRRRHYKTHRPVGDTTTLGAKGPVKLKNPPANGRSILRTFPSEPSHRRCVPQGRMYDKIKYSK